MKIWVTQLTVKIGIKISIIDFDFHSFSNVPVVFYLAKTLFEGISGSQTCLEQVPTDKIIYCFWLARRGVVNIWVMPVGFIGYVWRSYKYRELNQDWTRTPLQTAADTVDELLFYILYRSAFRKSTQLASLQCCGCAGSIVVTANWMHVHWDIHPLTCRCRTCKDTYSCVLL